MSKPRVKRKKNTPETRNTTMPTIPRKPKVKVVEKQKSRINRQPIYDDVDKEALKHMHKLRVDWSPEEDRVLLLCRVAIMYIALQAKKQVTIFQRIRDCLHRMMAMSKNKTSRACQRRINYMMKDPITQKSVAIFFEDLKQCKDVQIVFKNIPKEKLNIGFVVSFIL